MYAYHGIKFFLLTIDVYSRHIWCEVLTSKHAEVVRAAFDKILSEAKCIPEKLESDKGWFF
jgi:hypothetical protein